MERGVEYMVARAGRTDTLYDGSRETPTGIYLRRTRPRKEQVEYATN